LIEKNVLSAREIQDEIEAWEKKNPEKGAEIIARSWVDDDFKNRLLSDGNKAVAELGFTVESLKLVALENTLMNYITWLFAHCAPVIQERS
jgi:nitrile hydratase